jgi:hypothetical protein
MIGTMCIKTYALTTNQLQVTTSNMEIIKNQNKN